MYKIKANGNYNIILSDIGVYFSYPREVFVSEDDYKRSKHIQMFLNSGIITVEKTEVNNTSSSSNSKKNQDSPKKDTVFVKEGSIGINNDGAFVRVVEEESKVNVQEVHHVNVVDVDLNQEQSIEEQTPQQETVVDAVYSAEEATYTLENNASDEIVIANEQLNLIELESLTEELSEQEEVVLGNSPNEESNEKPKSFGRKKFNKKK